MREELLLFAYGTLALGKVQMRLLGRVPESDEDVLRGFAATTVVIDDPDVLATSGMATHIALVPTDDPRAAIRGKALRVTEADFAALAPHESANYRRAQVTLVSGRRAWTYLKSS